MVAFNITFKMGEGVYCSNIVKADSEELAKKHYTDKGYEVLGLSLASDYDLSEAVKRGKPVVEVETVEDEEESEKSIDELKAEPEIGQILCDINNGRYYITGIDGDKILYREFYEEDNGDMVVCGAERYMYLDEFLENPDFSAVAVSDDVKIIREY